MGSGKLMARPTPPPGFVYDDEADTRPPPPPGFVYDDPTPRPVAAHPDVASLLVAPGAQPHDGDTFPIGDARGRLYGVDAPELNQQGSQRDGTAIPIGIASRDYLAAQLADGAQVRPTGSASYGRSVASLLVDGNDVGRSMLDAGMGVAAPDYLRSDRARLGDYMEAERLARLNRRGNFGTAFQMPDAYRHKDPWAAAEASADGKGAAYFPDEPTPFAGLRPEIEQAYIALAGKPGVTPDELIGFARDNGFQIDPRDAAKFAATMAKPNAEFVPEVGYRSLPKPLTNVGDGAGGAFVRGFGDPINFLDEVGGIVDTLTGLGGRESIWNSDRRFGDVLWNNIDQNRSILDYDDTAHPYARFGGQLASGLAIPGGSVEGVGFGAARTAIRTGAGRLAAEAAAKAAVRNRLALTGAIEGGLAGAGSAEGGPIERLPSTLIGTGAGAAAGAGLFTIGRAVSPALRRWRGRGLTDEARAPTAGARREAAEPASGLDENSAEVQARAAQQGGGDPAPVPSPFEAQPAQPPVDDWMARSDAGRARYEQSAGGLWQMPADQLKVLHGAALDAERGQLREALRRAGIDETPGMGLGGENMERAAERVNRAVEAKLGEVPEDIDRLIAPRWEDHQEGGLPNAEDVAEVLRGHGLAIEGDDPHALASEVGWALRDLKSGDLEAVARGNGGISAQRAMVTMQNGYRALQAQGVTSAQMPGMIRDAMVRNGVSPGTADELTGMVFEMLQPAAARGAQNVKAGRAALPAPGAEAALEPGERSMAQAVQPMRFARTLTEAREHALDFVGVPLRNDATGVEAVVSGGNLKKMTSASAHVKSTSPDDHALAVANVDDLFRRAELVDRYPDERGEPTISAISRWHAPLETPNGIRTARMTVKETTHPNSPNPLYTVETIEVDGGGGARFGSGSTASAPGQIRNAAPAGSADDISPWAGISNAPRVGRARRMDQPASPFDMADLARTVEPGDVTPLPANTIESLDEAMQAMPSTHREVQAPDERDTLPRFTLPDGRTRRQPLDLIGWLRTRAGVKDDGGDLRAMGIDNRPRADLDFSKDEGFLGRLVNPEGQQLDEAAERAWEAGFFPDLPEPPTVNELLDAIDNTHRGTRRTWRPDDLDTVNTYNATRDQRRAVEQAQVEGNSFVEEVGEPVTMADLDANAAPATAYEDLPAIGAKAGNIALDRLESSEDIRRALQSVEAKVGSFDAARRGKISHGETAALAREMGMTAEDLLKRRQGQALNAEQALAARSILAKSGGELVRLAEKVADGGNEAMAAFREGWLKHVAIQEQVSGATAEAGRALSQFRVTAKAEDARGRVLKALVEGGGGEDRLNEVAQAVLDLKDPAKVNRYLRKVVQPRFRDKLTELYMNSLLSGPQTHAVNILSNTLMALGQLPEHAAAAAIGRVRTMVPNANPDRVLATEVGARFVGMTQGLKEGLRQAASTMRTGEGSDFMSKVESQSMEAISGAKGNVIRTPTRALSAEDELFKAIARRSELWGLATRKAHGEGLKGKALRQRIATLANDPDDTMLERAFDFGRYTTFQRPLGPIGQSISRVTTNQPALKLVVPFVRTPTNILKYAAERSPAAPLLASWRADLAAGGARRDLALARASVGTMVGALAMEWAAGGHITGGGPADKSAERLMRADGWQPYSIRVGDRYYSYQRLDPFATTLGVAADMIDLQSHMTDTQRENVVSLLGASVMQNLASKTWLSGFADFSEAMSDPGRFLNSYLSRMAASIAVPAIVTQTARTIDPFMREARTPLDRIRSRVPGISDDLPARRDIWGEAIRSEGGIGPDMVSPVWTSTAKKDQTVAGLLAAGVSISPPQRSYNQDGKRVEWTPEQYGRLSEATGKFAKPIVDALVRGPGWTGLDEDSQQDAVSGVMRKARASARELIAAELMKGGAPKRDPVAAALMGRR